jgi:hypothetical protein
MMALSSTPTFRCPRTCASNNRATVRAMAWPCEARRWDTGPNLGSLPGFGWRAWVGVRVAACSWSGCNALGRNDIGEL